MIATDSTHAPVEPQGNWLYGMKKWMEKEGIRIHNTTEDRPLIGVMNWCTRKTGKQRVWLWAKRNNIEQIADILDADHEIRTWMFNKDERDVEEIMKEAIGTWKSKGSPHVGVIGRLRQGCWVKNKDQIARIQRITADKIKVKIISENKEFKMQRRDFLKGASATVAGTGLAITGAPAIASGKIEWTKVLEDFWKDFYSNVNSVKEKRTREVLDLLNDSLGNLIFDR